MAEPEKAGTPPTETPVSESAGTGAQAADGSEQTGKPVDPALAMAWKEKAERYNEVERKYNEAMAQIEAARQMQYAQQQQADPMAQMIAQLREEAPYDPKAQAQLSILAMTATQQAELVLNDEMYKAQIPADKWDTVKGLVRQSGYRMSVSNALQLARGSEVPDLAKQLEAERARVAALEKALNGQTVAANKPGNPATVVPAAANAGDVVSVTLEEYMALPKELRDKATIKR